MRVGRSGLRYCRSPTAWRVVPVAPPHALDYATTGGTAGRSALPKTEEALQRQVTTASAICRGLASRHQPTRAQCQLGGARRCAV